MISIALLLFIVLDPFGNLVTLNTLLRAATPARRRRIIIRESIIALGILQLFVFAGGAILHALGLLRKHLDPADIDDLIELLDRWEPEEEE